MSPPPPSATRRTALTGTLAGLAVVAGCDDDGSRDGPAIGPSTGAPVADEGDADDPDAALVEEAQQHLLTALGTALAARRVRALRPVARPLVRLHGAHLSALGLEGGTALHSTEVGDRVRLRDVRHAERRLQGQLTDAAVRAESGALARLLASMAAAVAQHRAELP